jgi:SAM-dependent methyltransferase
MSEQVRSDFDRLALLDEDDWNHNNHYHPFLLAQVPTNCQRALDIGCGSGEFSRRLAERSEQVLGLDLAPEMIRLAQERSRGLPNLEFEVADVLTRQLPPESYDCIVSIATFHHLPLAEILPRIKAALKPGGVLLVLDLFRAERVEEQLMGLLAVPTGLVLRLLKTGRLREPKEVRQAWAEHCAHDVYLSLAEIRQACEGLLPGAQVRRHWLWRYSLVWKKAG